jgi:hypothetical protein
MSISFVSISHALSDFGGPNPAGVRVCWNEMLGFLPFEEGLKIITQNLCVPENLGQKSWSDSLTGVHWNCGRPAI